MKTVPKLQNFEQKQRSMDSAQEMLTKFNDDLDLLKHIITGDEAWMYGYDIETKAVSYQRKRSEELRLKTALQIRSNVNALRIVSFDCAS